MANSELPSETENRPILPWRLVGGVFLHFLVPYYLIAALIDVLFVASPVHEPGAALHRILRASPVLLGGYAALALFATLLAAVTDPLLRARRDRRAAAHPQAPALRSDRMLRDAIGRGTGRFGARADAALAALGESRWDFASTEQQALVRALAEAIAASVDAIISAPPERRGAIADMAAGTIEHIVRAQRELAVANAAQDERKASAAAGYVEMRYGPSDFSGSGD